MLVWRRQLVFYRVKIGSFSKASEVVIFRRFYIAKTESGEMFS